MTAIAALVLAVCKITAPRSSGARDASTEREDDILDSLLASGNDDWREVICCT